MYPNVTKLKIALCSGFFQLLPQKSIGEYTQYKHGSTC